MRLRILAAAVGAFVFAVPSDASAVARTFVSGTGADTGSCPATAPCATFQFAHDITDARGSIVVLSSGDFGPVTITKSISILSNGVEALIRTGKAVCGGSTGAAICIDAGLSDNVIIRGLTIDLNSAARHGIRHNSGASLHLQKCTIRRTAGLTAGIAFLPTATSDLYVTDCNIAATAIGIGVSPAASGNANVVLDRVQIEQQGLDGVSLGYSASGTGKINATIRDSLISGIDRNGIVASQSGGGTQKINVMADRITVTDSATAVNAAGAGVTVRIGDSTISGNTTGVAQSLSAAVLLFTTNVLEGNGNDFVTPLLRKRR